MAETIKLNASKGLYEFGPFRLETRERRLLKDGQPISLQPKVFDTLGLLVENAGHVVTKSELMASLWPGTTVEEGNLTKNIWLIRKALGESEGENRYIETVPRAGYRFVAPLRPIAAERSPVLAPEAAPPLLFESSAAPATMAGRPTSRRVPVVAAGAALVLLTGVFWTLERNGRGRSTPVTPRPAAAVPGPARRGVAVLGFQNLSGRSEAGWLSTAVSEMISAELAGAETLRLVPAENIARFGDARQPPIAGTLSRETLANLRGRLDADLVLSGSYVAMISPGGDAVRFDMTLQDTATGETLATVTETGKESDLFALVSSAGGRLRADLGLSPASSSEGAVMAASLPNNREAARLYANGLAKLRTFDALGAQPLFEASIRAEADFGPAHEALSRVWSALGYDEKARVEAEESFRLASGSPPALRASAEARLAESEKNWARAESLEAAILRAHPDDLEAALRLGAAQTAGGRAREALATLSALGAFPEPARNDPRIDLARADALAALSKWPDERRAAGSAAEKARRNGSTLLLASARLREASALSALGDGAGSRRAYEEASTLFRRAGDSNGEADALIGIAGREGSYDAARTLWLQAQATFQRIGNRRGEARAASDLALLDWLQGDVDAALRGDRLVLEINRSINDQRGVIWALNAWGNVLADQGQFDRALAFQQEAVGISRKIGDEGYLSYGLGSLGDTRLAQGRLEEARGNYEQALALSKKLKDPEGVATHENDLGNVSAEAGRLSDAEAHYQAAFAARLKLGLEDEKAETQMLIAQLRNVEMRFPEAAKLAGETARTFTGLGQTGNAAISLANEARAELGLGRIAEAQALCGKARGLLKNNRQNGAALPVLMEALRVETAGTNLAAAKALLAEFETHARKAGWLFYILEARRADAELEIRTGRKQDGLREARSLAEKARLEGFGLVAAEAQNLLADGRR
jgi:DNA-binding winged helix-turn-helix (wHTH) protein/TolB-like protein/predicted negative regulator of RcsB-dependent stress response